MKKLLYSMLILLIMSALFGQEAKLLDSTFFSTVTQMESDNASLKVKEAGPIERIAVSSGIYTIDANPYRQRDYIPPTRPTGLRGTALNSSTIKVTCLPSTDNVRVIGYKVYRNNLYIAFTDDASFLDTGLTEMTMFSYAMQAVDKSQNISPVSEPIFVATLDHVAENSPPRFVNGPFVSYASNLRAVIEFTANKAVNASIVYGKTQAYGSQLIFDEYLTGHTITLTGLSPQTLYHYKVTIDDYNGNGPVTSSDCTFYTIAEADYTAPDFLTGPSMEYISGTCATVSFQADEEVRAFVRYGETSTDENYLEALDSNTVHSITLTGLSPSTAYSLKVGITDLSGNGPVFSRVVKFKTLCEADTTPPHIYKKPRVVYLSDRCAVLNWQTNEISNSVVLFGTEKETYTRQEVSQTMVKNHIVLLFNLEKLTKYYFTVTSTDPSGNTSDPEKEDHFTTKLHQDNKPPHIQKVRINVYATDVVISWQTDGVSDGKILFGTGPGNYIYQKYDSLIDDQHSIRLNNLDPETRYYFRLIAKDPAGLVGQSIEYTFKTGKIYNHGQGHSGCNDDNGNNGNNNNGNNNNGNNNNGNNNNGNNNNGNNNNGNNNNGNGQCNK